MTHAERRLLVRTIYAGASLLLIGFLPWVGGNSAWSSLFALGGTYLPGWMVVVCGAAVAVMAFLELRGNAAFPWKLYLGISIYAVLHSGAFFVFGLARSDFQIGPPLALAAFVATALAAIGMRPRGTKRPRRKRKTKRGPGRKSGPSR
jgi:hypothetical protein